MVSTKYFVYSHWLKWYYKSAKQKIQRLPADSLAGGGSFKARIKLLSSYPKLQLKH
jgi:hypothetical protein